MTEAEARRLLFVRAIESADTAEAVLTREDRRHASAAALAQSGTRARGRADPRRDDEAFLVRRSAFAFSRIEGRHPGVTRAVMGLQWPAWLSWSLPLGALLLGLATNELDNGRRLNIIAAPMLGMLVWNLAVFAWLAVQAASSVVRGQQTRPPNILARLVGQLSGWAQARREGGQPLKGAIARFSEDWLRRSAGLTYSRGSRTLHLAAAALAAGILLGMYLRALSVEYRAGWESTFIDATTLRWLLGAILGPASAISGVPLPNPQALQAMAWSSGGPGQNAGPWLHLYALTATLFIIAPRLLLAGWHALRAARLSARFPAPGPEDFYIRQLLRSAHGGGGLVRVVPYGFHPSEPARRRLEQRLTQVLGDGTRCVLDTAVDYGGEDEWLATASLDPDLDHLVILFSLAATPEAENHGALVAGVRRRLAAHASDVALTVLVDEAPWRERLAGQTGADARLAQRRAAWDAALGREGVASTFIDTAEADTAALTQRLEGALMKNPSLTDRSGR